MTANISSLADTSSVLYRRRAGVTEIADIPTMDLDGWKRRLADGIAEKKMSQREVSLASGNGPGYVNSLIKEGKDPTITNLIKVCEAANLSLIYVLFGVKMDRQTEEIVATLAGASQLRRDSLLHLLRDEDEKAQNPSSPATGAPSGE